MTFCVLILEMKVIFLNIERVLTEINLELLVDEYSIKQWCCLDKADKDN